MRETPAPRNSIRAGLLVAALGACLGAPGMASAAPVPVAPPGLEPSGDVSVAAARNVRDPGCVSRNDIAFLRDAPSTGFPVRHFGRIKCEVRTRISCLGRLVHYGDGTQPGQVIARDEGTGRNRCRYGSGFASSARYPFTDLFGEFFRYTLTLRNERQRWAGTSDFCPKRKARRRVLVCRDAFSTRAPRDAFVRHR